MLDVCPISMLIGHEMYLFIFKVINLFLFWTHYSIKLVNQRTGSVPQPATNTQQLGNIKDDRNLTHTVGTILKGPSGKHL